MTFFKLLENNLTYIILSFCIIASTLAIMPGGTLLYGAGVFYIFVYLLQNFKNRTNDFKFYLFFLLAILLSNIFNLVFDIRYFNFLFLIFVCSPLLPSSKNIFFKMRLLTVLFYVVIFFTVVNLCCYYAGINMAQELYKDIANDNDFSGIMVHPMWLSAFSGLSTVVAFYFFLSTEKIMPKFGFLLLVLISILVTILGASRTALFASFIVLAIILFLYESRRKVIANYILSIAIISIVSYPIFINNSKRIQMKIDTQKERGVSSRDQIWEDRISEFEDSPIVGVGFATLLDKNGNQITGKLESGSGWLSVLSQTGLMGFLGLIIIIRKAIPKWKYIKQNKDLSLYYGVFIYLCIHSIAEGYILTAGYYLCFLFWLVLDVLVEYRSYSFIQQKV